MKSSSNVRILAMLGFILSSGVGFAQSPSEGVTVSLEGGTVFSTSPFSEQLINRCRTTQPGSWQKATFNVTRQGAPGGMPPKN